MGRSADTPLMRQYLAIKAAHPDAILFFRLGDFYEMFFDDAVVAAELLELTLTTRDKNKQDPVPMCGVPHHAANNYVRKLLELGHKVAICEQVEDPKTARGVVRREVTEVVTPGVIVDSAQLDAKRNNFLVALAGEGERWGVAALDLSTFELQLTEADDRDELLDELVRLRPREVVYGAMLEEAVTPLRARVPVAWHALELTGERDASAAAELIAAKAGADPQELGLQAHPLASLAGAAAIHYAEQAQPARGVPRCRVLIYRTSEHLQLDEPTINNLELFRSAMEGKREGSLLAAVDGTLTAMGGRLLRRILARPLRDISAIRRRHDAVELLVEQAALRADLLTQLRQIYDLERLTSRTVLGLATPRELGRLGRSLAFVPELIGGLARMVDATLAHELPELLRGPEDLLPDVAERIEQALVDDPPATAREGGIFREGVDSELDELVSLCDGGRSTILAMEARLREETGIGSLKIRFNRVFGYFIEVSKAKLDRVPESFRRKQTLANAERYVIPELADYEAQVLGAEERRHALEQRLFEQLRAAIGEQVSRLTEVAEFVARLDVLCGFAEIAQRHDYVRPVVDDSSTIELVGARHPVVERHLAAGSFVPNDLRIDDRRRLLILTGPNMSGKSTIMRQAALTTLLAQAGSFVPCARARVGVADRIFTRVGASDNLARGDSTFMVEMRETAAILRHGSSKSLVLLDEVGRGTATYDGLSIAWAVAEHLHDEVRARTLFATHYHELCQLTEVKRCAHNLSVAVEEWKGRVVFLHRLVEGGANRSYGIEVARLAGLPRDVVARARAILRALETGERAADLPLGRRTQPARTDQLSLFGRRDVDGEPCSASDEQPGARPDPLIERLRGLDLDRVTPLAALNLLAELSRAARERGQKN